MKLACVYFNRTAELPFAGHPTIGAATVLANKLGAGRTSLRIEVASGVVLVSIHPGRGDGISGASIVAPQSLALGQQFSFSDLAACLTLEHEDLITTRHMPQLASTGVEFIFVELAADALSRANPGSVCHQGASPHN